MWVIVVVVVNREDIPGKIQITQKNLTKKKKEKEKYR